MPKALVLLLPLLFAFSASAAPALPYAQRTQGYSGWSTTVRGDIRTLGMAGATVALADSFIGSVDNPAGLAMTLQSSGIQISQNYIHDGNVQSYDEQIKSTHVGAASAIYPWGFGIGYWSPSGENQTYRLQSGTDQNLEVFTRELRLSAARVFFDNRLALGASAIVGKSSETIGGVYQDHYAFSAALGALYQLPHRVLLGISYTPPLSYSSDPDPSPLLPGFFQPVRSPYRLAFGAGWIPNRFFRFGLAFYLVGSTGDTALLADNSVSTGGKYSLQPRTGLSYLFAEYKEFQGQISAGSYVEGSRIQSHDTRVHLTAGLELNPWIFSVGWGIDTAANYRNFIFSAGLDVLKIMRKLDLIPREWRPPYGGLFPHMTHLSEDGLPRPLVKNWNERQSQNLLEIGRELPRRLELRVRKTEQQLEEIGNKVIEALQSVPEKAKPKTGKEPKSKKKRELR